VVDPVCLVGDGPCDIFFVDAARFVGADRVDIIILLKDSIFEADSRPSELPARSLIQFCGTT
jgi:hypothetical protein